MVVTRILRNLGCTFEVVDNGRKAADACRERRFDVILMDCHMPEMVRPAASSHANALRCSSCSRTRYYGSALSEGMLSFQTAVALSHQQAHFSRTFVPAGRVRKDLNRSSIAREGLCNGQCKEEARMKVLIASRTCFLDKSSRFETTLQHA